MAIDSLKITGSIKWEIHDEDGVLLRSGFARNLTTSIGSQMYAMRGSNLAGAPSLPTGMKLGTGNLPPAKTGAGAALQTYLAGSDRAFNSGYPQGSQALSYKVFWQCTWAAGVATTNSPITEVVLVNDALTDATSTAAHTIARARVFGVPNKPSGQSITITWEQDIG